MSRHDPFAPSGNVDNDLVERLVSIADRGPVISDAELEAAKAAVWPEWQRQVRAYRRRRRLGWTAGAAVAASLLIAVGSMLRTPSVAAPAAVAAVERVVGSATLVAEDGSSRTLSSGSLGEPIPAGTALHTGADTRVALKLLHGQSLRIDQSSSVVLADRRAVALSAGAVYIDSGAAGVTGLEVRTALGTATDIGTQFEVRSEDDRLVIRVREGVVRLDRDSDHLDLASGFQAAVSSDGNVATRVITAVDPAWAWTQSVAPTFAIEGKTVRAFLTWVSRETGLRIHYDSRQAEMLASTTQLHGSTDGLSPLEATEVVLPSCGLTARIDGAVLVLSVLQKLTT